MTSACSRASAYHHPLLDAKFKIDPADRSIVWTDDELESLMDDYLAAARLAREAGFQFVDVKTCHGYLLHEFLSARVREGKYGGDFAGRTRILMTLVGRIRHELPDLLVGVRLSVFDTVPFETSREPGRPYPHADLLPYRYGFGVDEQNPARDRFAGAAAAACDAARCRRGRGQGFLRQSLLLSPRAASGVFPPSDGYLPPEDPLIGAWRQIDVARRCKQAVPGLPMVGSGYSYLQDYLPHVAQAAVRDGWIDAVGLGRMVLAYPELPVDTLRSGKLARKSVCRTFSDCTTAPRAGMISGCFPLDSYYRDLPEADELKAIKQRLKDPAPPSADR